MDLVFYSISKKSIAMTNNEILRANMLDILFENRNKAYGAYALRKNYNHRLQWAVSISLGLVLLLVMITLIDTSGSSKTPEPTRTTVELTMIDAPDEKKPEEPEKKPEKQKPVEQQVKLTANIKITNETDFPPLDDIISAKISNITVAGTPPTGVVDTTTATPDKGEGKNPVEPAKEFVPVSSDPKFPGGKDAFAEFLKNNLITPEELELGEKKIVQIRFMVDIDGSISKAEVIQSGGRSFDKEVIRVLRKMPKWIPAMQNGIKVATYFTQPVIFMGVEE